MRPHDQTNLPSMISMLLSITTVTCTGDTMLLWSNHPLEWNQERKVRMSRSQTNHVLASFPDPCPAFTLYQTVNDGKHGKGIEATLCSVDYPPQPGEPGNESNELTLKKMVSMALRKISWAGFVMNTCSARIILGNMFLKLRVCWILSGKCILKLRVCWTWSNNQKFRWLILVIICTFTGALHFKCLIQLECCSGWKHFHSW